MTNDTAKTFDRIINARQKLIIENPLHPIDGVLEELQQYFRTMKYGVDEDYTPRPVDEDSETSIKAIAQYLEDAFMELNCNDENYNEQWYWQLIDYVED